MSSVLYAYSIAFPKSFLLCWLVNGFVLKKKEREREREKKKKKKKQQQQGFGSLQSIH